MFTAAVTPLDQTVLGLAYSSSLGMFAAVGVDLINTVTVATSVNGGVGWSAQTSPWDPGGIGTCVCWSPDLSLFVAGGLLTTPALITSANGIAWAPQTSPVDGFYVYSVVWAASPGLFAAAAADFGSPFPFDGYIVTSPDGITWTTAATFPSDYITSISWSEALGRFLACSSNTSTSGPWTSPDGITWQQQQTDPVFVPTATFWVDDLGVFVAAGSDGGNVTDKVVATSFDGGVTPWQVHDSPFNNGLAFAVGVADDGQALVSGYDSQGRGTLMSSPDGMHWRVQPTPLDPFGTISGTAVSSTVTVLGGA